MFYKVRKEEFNEYYWYVGQEGDIVDFINKFEIKAKVRIWVKGECCVRVLRADKVNELITNEYYEVEEGKEEGYEVL